MVVNNETKENARRYEKKQSKRTYLEPVKPMFIRSFKTEINPTKSQIDKIERDFKSCRLIYNLYLTFAIYQVGRYSGFADHEEFLAWFYSKGIRDPRYSRGFPNRVNTDAVRKVCQRVEKLVNKYSMGLIRKPETKDYDTGYISLYFVSKKRGEETVISQRHRIFIPEFGWIRLKEKGYIPVNNEDHKIISGYISSKAGRYYISVNVLFSEKYMKNLRRTDQEFSEPIGIDLGIEHFATLSDGRVFENINYSEKIKRLQKHIYRKHRSLSRKHKALKELNRSIMSGSNYQINKKDLAVLYKRANDMRIDHLNKVINEIVSTRPKYIAIEDLYVKEMVKERLYAKSISELLFWEFRNRLIKKCDLMGIEVRIVNKWYPSSKMCHKCRRIKKDLKHSDRVFRCECGYVANRDYNASLNIRDSDIYTIAHVDDMF